jgi:hypothetical protein
VRLSFYLLVVSAWKAKTTAELGFSLFLANVFCQKRKTIRSSENAPSGRAIFL